MAKNLPVIKSHLCDAQFYTQCTTNLSILV